MSDGIIDITRHLRGGGESVGVPGTMALWGADGERSRFALPLWRIINLAEAVRGMIAWKEGGSDGPLHPFVVLDLGRDPARIDPPAAASASCDTEGPGSLHDLGADGIVVELGAKGGRAWCLVTDGGEERTSALEPRSREDILFLAGECAGLLFLRELAGTPDGPEASIEDVPDVPDVPAG